MAETCLRFRLLTILEKEKESFMEKAILKYIENFIELSEKNKNNKKQPRIVDKVRKNVDYNTTKNYIVAYEVQF